VDYRLPPRRLIEWTAPYAALCGLLWALSVCAGVAAAEQSYTVKRGDTLYGIAQRHGVSSAALAERNGLNRNQHVYAGQRLRIPAQAAARPHSYTVRRGDTLFGIAQRHGITCEALAECNGLNRDSQVYVGQRLTIPGVATAGPKVTPRSAATQKIARVELPRSLRRAIDRAAVREGRWEHIVIHHSGTDTGSMRTFDKYHRQVRHMENGLAYHFVVGNGNGMRDGEIGVSPRWTRQLDGGHLASAAQNKIALGICLVGNFDKRRPTARQMQSLRTLVEALMARCKLAASAVKTHQQFNVVHTRCPGALFPVRTFLDSLHPPSR